MGTEAARNRVFYVIEDHGSRPRDVPSENSDKLISYISKNIIGRERVFKTPYGYRQSVYLDYSASGRSLQFIEDYIRDHVLTDYGNTHTTSTHTSLQTTLFRHESRDIIRNAVNASEHDSVIFCGTGTTGAVRKLIHALDFKTAPIMFIGPHEHHSNMLPWREIAAKVISVPETASGAVDIDYLHKHLQMWSSSNHPLIGCFSAASNITGTLTPTNEITSLLHRYGARAFWDYATAAPYIKIDMNPVVTSDDQPYVYKDAIYFSVHKFIGGVSTPGILIAKKYLFKNASPETPGGGTVFFVTENGHRYLREPEMREEGGTPGIVESIRAGLVIQLKQAVGCSNIMSLERQHYSYAMNEWRNIDNLIILGRHETNHLPIFSFVIHNPQSGYLLHHNFVTILLNDLFGIQTRGGCACAGPYAQRLLGIDEDLAEIYDKVLAEDVRLDRHHLRRKDEYSDLEVLRPGFTRIGFPYFVTETELEFAVKAVAMVAEHGWRLLPRYMFNPQSGEWRARHFQVFKERRWLSHISYSSNVMQFPLFDSCQFGAPSSKEVIQAAYEEIYKSDRNISEGSDHRVLFGDDVNTLRWFVLPSEVACILKNRQPVTSYSALPFCPETLKSRLSTSDTPFQCNLNYKKYFSTILQDNLSKNFSNLFQLQKPLGTYAVKDISNISDTNMTQLKSSTKYLVDGSDSSYNISEKICDYIKLTKSSNPGTCDIKQSSTEVKDIKQKSVECIVKTNESVIQCVSNDLLVKSNDVRQDDKINGCILNKCIKPSYELTNGRAKWFVPGKNIFKPFLEAVEKFSMIHNGDKVLICLSGGKDSLSLLHTVNQYRYYSRSKGIHFKFGAVTVDPSTSSYDPSSLVPILASLNVPYHYETQDIFETATNLPYECASICSFCSRMKRGRIYACARREGYNVVALGQHLDDLAESFLMSAFHNGVLNTMKAHYTIRAGDLRVIRPFVYVREKMLRDFAEKNKLPVIAENCPACFESPKERQRIKQLLASQEILHPRLFASLRSAIAPLVEVSELKTSLNNKCDDDEGDEICR